MNPSQAASRVSIESDAFVFHYLIEADVCYLTLTDRGYPKKLAYQYLEELQSEFSRLYGQQLESIARPYAFIKFGAATCSAEVAGQSAPVPRLAPSPPLLCVSLKLYSAYGVRAVSPPQLRGWPDSAVRARVPDTFIQKTKKLYLDTRTQRNIAKLSEDLNEVHSIMTRNIAEVLGQGERLDSARPRLLEAVLRARVSARARGARAPESDVVGKLCLLVYGSLAAWPSLAPSPASTYGWLGFWAGMSKASEALMSESKQYKTRARDLHRQVSQRLWSVSALS